MSFEIRKFYEVATPDAPVNIASIMAKSGIKTDADPVEIPNIITETKKVEATQVPEKVETTVPVAVGPAETPPPPTNPAPVQVQNIPEPIPEVKPLDWKEVLKSHNPDQGEVMKAIGLDEKMVGLFNTWRTTGDVRKYLEAVSTDYSKMTAEDVMKHYLQQKFPEFSNEDFQELYRAKVIEQYKLDPTMFEEKDIKLGKILLQADAKDIRENLMRQQKEYILAAKPPEPATSPADTEAEKQAQQDLQAWNDYVSQIKGDKFTQEFTSTKLIPIGEGDDQFKYEVPEPQKLTDILLDRQKWASKLFNQDGTPNTRKQYLVAAILDDDAGFFQQYGNHFKRVGAKKIGESIENASQPTGTLANSESSPSDPAKALARNGVITSG